MRLASRVLRVSLVVMLLSGVAGPLAQASGPAASLGTARGVRSVELSLDGGKTWLPLGSRSLPILDGTQLRSTHGGARLDLTDGSRLNVLPFTSVRFRETGAATEVSLVYGRLTFRLPQKTQLEIRTASGRLEPVRQGAMAGEAFVGSDGTLGLRMTQGTLRVEELGGSKRTLLASLEPVFLPKRPAQSGPLFSSDAPAAPPAGARAVFSPSGESLGYLGPNGQLVVHPGYTADLTQPFPAKLVQVAMAKVPEKDRTDAVPVFDVNGGYTGYLAGPVYHAQAVGVQGVQVAQGSVGDAGAEGGIPGWVWIGGVLVFVGAGTYLIVDNAGGGGGTTVATPLRPRR